MKQYLSFNLDNEHYAIEVQKVNEVQEFEKLTKIPNMPRSMIGVINLRGRVVPIIDLRIKFGLPEKDRDVDTSIIVLDLHLNESDEELILGVLVDSVDEVMSLDDNQIDPPPRLGSAINSDFIEGMGKVDDKFYILLDTQRVFTTEDYEAVKTAESAAAAGQIATEKEQAEKEPSEKE